MVGALEREDPRLAGREQRRAERDLDRILAGDRELGGPGQPAPQLGRHLGLGQIAERVYDPLLPPGLEDSGIAMSERSDPEAAGEVKVLAPVAVDDAATLSF